MPTLYLIDGYAQFFRAYHAIRTPMTSPVTKEPTNMTFGFVGLLLKLLKGTEPGLVEAGGAPDYLAVALDVSGDRGTFRSELYPAYKATRDEIPERLPVQIDRAMSLLDAIGVPMLGAQGFEADDVIATLVKRLRAERPDVKIRIISKDKDLKQLLEGDAVEMYDAHHDTVIDEKTLAEDSGLTPAQVVDMLALMGDTVDNVPGVDGIGPKTAAQLIAEFGTLDAVVAEATADKPKKDWVIKGKRRENIAAAADRLDLSRQLVTLRDDAPFDFDLDLAAVERLRLAELGPILRDLGFNRYQDELKELLGTGGTPPASAQGGRDDRPTESGVGTLFADLESASTADNARTKTGIETRVVRTSADLDELAGVLRSAELVAVDTETTATRPMRADLVGLSFAIETGTGWYVPVRSPEPGSHLDADAVLGVLGPVLEDASVAKVGHNLKYDALVLRRHGITLRGWLPTPDHPGAGDTMIASYLIDASRSSHAMDALAIALLNHRTIPIRDLIGSGKNQRTFDQVPLDLAAPYAAEDAEVTLRLNAAERPQLTDMGLDALYMDLEMPLVPVLAELEFNGVRVDPDELDRQRERLETEIVRLKAAVDEASQASIERTFDLDSPRQLSQALFNKPSDDPPGLGIKPVRKTKTGYSTDAEVLQKLADDATLDTPIPTLILEYRQLSKLVNTYLSALKDEIHPQTGRIHASFNQTVAATGRLSSSDPNLQNIPIRTEIGREIRRAFVAADGCRLISADYSQIELRLLAHLSNDPALIQAFIDGEDIHRAVAAQIHGVAPGEVTREQRSGAKMVNFGIVYGITAYGLARRLGVSNTEAEEIITGYKRRFAGITTFLEECIAFARDRGYVETIMKRRRPITEIDARNPQRRALAERMAINSVVQGSAADLIKLAMVDLHARITARTDGLGDTKMLLQIHDELVFEAPAGQAEAVERTVVDRMQRAMDGAADLRVPLVVESAVSGDWFGGK